MDPDEAFETWDEHVDWMADRYENGWSYQQIADELDGIHFQQVRRRLINAGVVEGDLRVPNTFRQTQEWRKARREALDRDDHTCQSCGRTEDLHVHHIESPKNGGAKYDLENLVTLCSECHVAVHAE